MHFWMNALISPGGLRRVICLLSCRNAVTVRGFLREHSHVFVAGKAR